MPGKLTPLDIAPVTLTGRFVRLEPLTRAHTPALAAIAFEPSLWTWTAMRIDDAAALELYMDDAMATAANGSALPFAIVHLGEERVVGSTRFMNISARDGRVEIGSTWLGTAWHRTPVNTEAKFLLLRHAFETLGATRVELKTHAMNAKSRAAIERIGAQFEGIHRKHMLQPDNTRRDTAWYSIVDDEWQAVKARLYAMLR